MTEFWVAALVIVLCLVFTYTNGLQDGSSVTAGVIACRVLTPIQAVILVAGAELLGALFGGSAVANAVRSVTSWPERSDILPVLAAGLFSAISWNYLTKILRFPSSSTHALFGGILGALLAASGTKYIVWGDFNLWHPTGVCKILISLFISPMLGFFAGYVMINLVTMLLSRANQEVNRWLKFCQCITVALLAFGHGSNDPQKTMGVILLVLHATGVYSGQEIPFWVRAACGVSIALGVMSLAPGIVKRVGSGIYKLRVVHGFVMEAAAGAIVVLSSLTGCPVATSQVISSTIMGVGSGERYKDVRWLVARDILISWLLTIPCAGLFAYVLYISVFHWLGDPVPHH